MTKLKEAIHQALRDDSAATIGLRALLGWAATPYGVYIGHFPEQPTFKTSTGQKSYITWQFMNKTTTNSAENDARLREQVISVTAWSQTPDNVDAILERVRWVLENMRGVTLPTSKVVLHQILNEGEGPDLFDPSFNVYYRASEFRAFYREDITL